MVKSTALFSLFAVASVATAQVPGGGKEQCVGQCQVKGFSPLMEAKMRAKIAADQRDSELFASRRNQQIAPKGQYSKCTNGLAADFFPCDNVDLLSQVPLESLSAIRGNDVWGWVDRTTRQEYALYCHQHGVTIVDITRPLEPRTLVIIPTNSTNGSVWRDVKVYKNTAYIVADNLPGHGTQVFDLERLREYNGKPAPELPDVVEPDYVYTGCPDAHNIVINERTGYAMMVGSDTCAGGLHLIDLNKNRLAPEFAGCYSADGYVHDAECSVYRGPDREHRGKEICFCYNEDTLTIVDISDKTVVDGELSGAKMISRVTYEGASYVHQGWNTRDFKYLLLDDELDERANPGNFSKTYVFDIQDLDTPTLQAVYEAPTTAVDHNLYIRGRIAYMANDASGLRVTDISDIYRGGSLREVGFFDTFPDSDDPVFSGIWSSYPYFPSGNIALSTREFGLLTVRLDRKIFKAPELPKVSLDDSSTLSYGTIGGFSAAAALGLVAVGAAVKYRRREQVPEAKAVDETVAAFDPEDI